MQNGQLDMLQIKIDRARDALPKATRKAIDSVDWRAFILSLREKKGYGFEQLEDLELETELLLCGLLDPRDYPKTLEEELKLPKAQIDLLVQDMNKFVFEKIKNELIKNTEREDIFVKKEEPLPNLPLTKGEEKGGGLNLRTTNIEPVDTHIISPNVVKINNSPFLNPRITTEENKIPEQETQTSLPNPPLSKRGAESLQLENQGKNLKSIEIMPKEIQAPEQKKAEMNNKEIIANVLKGEIPKAEQSKITNPETKKEKTQTPPPNLPLTKGEEKGGGLKNTEINPENNTLNNNIGSIFSQKLSGSFKLPTIKTNYSENNTPSTPLSTKVSTRKADPYRIDPNE